MRWRLRGALLCVLVIGCSGGDDDDDGAAERSAADDADRGDYVAALVGSYDNPYTTPDDHRCMAEATVDVLGLEALVEAGTPAELQEADRLQSFGITPDEATAGELVDALDACVDTRTVLFGGPEQLSPEEATCIQTRLPDDLLRRFMISTYTSPTGFSDQPDLESQITTARESCRPPP